jgi:hypothetical protein
MSQNQTYGYIFDLNVTAFTNSSFVLLDLTAPYNDFFFQSGETLRTDPQPMYLPEAIITIKTPWTGNSPKNITNLIFSFPPVWVNVSQPGNSTPGPGPPVFLYMPTNPSKRPVFHASSFEAGEIIGSYEFPPISLNVEPVGVLFKIPQVFYGIRRLPWIWSIG